MPYFDGLVLFHFDKYEKSLGFHVIVILILCLSGRLKIMKCDRDQLL